MTRLGTIVALDGSPSTGEFSFVIDKGAKASKGQYVQATGSNGLVFGYIAEIVRANRYFEHAESVAEYSRLGSISDSFPAEGWEYVCAQVRILGSHKDGRFERSFSPPCPGSAVMNADNDVLRQFLGFEDSGMHLGSIQHHDVPANICMTRLLQKHCALLAMSGSGKCVTYDTPIMLANGATKKIGELAEECFSDGITEKEGNTEVAFIDSDISVLSLDEDLITVPNPIRAVTRRHSPENLLVLKTRTGRTASLTFEHPLLILNEKGPAWRKASEIKEGDHIAVPRQLSFGSLQEVNLLEFYKNSDKICVNDREVMLEVKKQLSKKGFKFSRRVRQGLTYDTLSLREFHELCENNDLLNSYNDIRNIKQKFSRNRIPSKLKLDKKLGRFVGYLMGDGHVKKNCLELSNITPEIRKDFVKIAYELFGFQALVLERSVRVHSKTLVSILSDVFGVKDSSEKKRITSTVLSSNKEFISVFLSGLFDSDGHVSLKKTEIEFCSKSENLAIGVSILLLKFGIISTQKVKHNKKYNRDYYIVFTRGSKTLKIFMDNIPFISEMKKERLIHSTSLPSNTNIDVIPSIIAPLLDKVMQKLRISESETARRAHIANNLSRYNSGGDALSRENFRKIVAVLQNRLEEIKTLCSAVDVIQLPASDLSSLLNGCRVLKRKNNIQYKLISSRCCVSASTARRMLCDETAITDSVLEIGKGTVAFSSQEESAPLAKLIKEQEAFAAVKLKDLFKLADGLCLSYRFLGELSCLHQGAWAAYKRGDRKPAIQSKEGMVVALKKTVNKIRKDIENCHETLNLLISLSNSSILWDAVSEIKDVKSNCKYVYDITLKDDHNFFAGTLPLIIHNSHLASVLLEELLDRRKEDGRIAVVVIDIHGEYAGFANDDNYGSRTAVVDGSEIFVPLRKVSPESIEEWLPHLSGPQRELLRHAMHELRRERKTEGYSMKELFAAIDEAEVSKEESKKTLKRALSELRRYRFLSRKKESPKLLSEVRPGRLLILDFSSIDSMRKKQILVALMARRLFRLRKKQKIPPFLLLIEEAHNFAREKAEAQNAISRSVIETIAREGRKFGASLCLISQRPVNLSTTALSQCNTHIILRVTNPNDLDHIQMSSEGIDSRVAKSITGLKVGEAIIVGAAVNHPTFVSIRQRRSKKREKGAPLHQQAREFEAEREKKEEQVEAFL